MLEAPVTTQDEVASEEHGEAPDVALLYGGVAPHPAFVHGSQEPPKREAGSCVRRGSGTPAISRTSSQPRNYGSKQKSL